MSQPRGQITSSSTKAFGNFDLVIGYEVPRSNVYVSRWKSRVTGLTVVHVDYVSPIIKAYIAVRTEIFNDSGCPHTLEHLIFMGSKKYPFKGTLDKLANRCFAAGTNAYTDVDHTCYTIETAGSQGLLQILPVYMDHIFNPTLTEEAFVTEVYHVTESGQESGVVFAEMQGRENNSFDRTCLSLQRAIFPEDSGYRSQTGGLTEAFRALDISQIRDYHKAYYVPHNVAVIVVGKLAADTTSLLSVLQNDVEPMLVANGFNEGPRPPGLVRPFVETASANLPSLRPLRTSVEFLERDESIGSVRLICRVPESMNLKALNLLCIYLAGSEIAPLNKEFVGIEVPFCTGIGFEIDEKVTFTMLHIELFGVPKELLESLPSRFTDKLRDILQVGVDLRRMRIAIDQQERQYKYTMEEDPGNAIARFVIDDFMRGPEDGSKISKMDEDYSTFDMLRSWSNEQWMELLSLVVDAPMVVVCAEPSSAFADKLEADKKARTAERRERLGPEGLKVMAQTLEKAKEKNGTPLPEEVLVSMPIPDIGSISWLPVQTVKKDVVVNYAGKSEDTIEVSHVGMVSPKAASDLEKHIAMRRSCLPFYTQFNHVKSECIVLSAIISCEKIPDRLRPLLDIYADALFSLPVISASGERLSHEDVIFRLDQETMSYGAQIGGSYGASEALDVLIMVENGKYDAAVRWLYDIIWGSQFDKRRLSIACAKAKQNLIEWKRSGFSVARSFSEALLFEGSSIRRMCSLVQEMKVIPDLLRYLEENPSSVVKDFEEIQQYLTRPEAIRINICGNVLAIPDPGRPWKQHFARIQKTPVLPVRLAIETLSGLGRNPSKKALVVDVPAVEDSYVMQTAKSLQGFKSKDIPPLIVGIEALNTAEGYLWKHIRGSGLAYDARIWYDQDAGLIHFIMENCTNTLEAFKNAAGVVRGLIDNSIELNDAVIDGARSSLVYAAADSVSLPLAAAYSSFLTQTMAGLSPNYIQDSVESCWSISVDDVRAVLKKYILPLFDPASSIIVVATTPSAVAETVSGLIELGYDAEHQSLDDGAEINAALPLRAKL